MKRPQNLHTLVLIVIVVVGAAVGEWYAAAAPPPDQVVCEPPGPASTLPQLSEASGVAVSVRNPGIVWSMNDSGEPVLEALDSAGRSRGQVRVTGADVRDWEDVTVAPCEQGSCLYVADIGDNQEERADITIYRVAEPELGARSTAPAERLVARYGDGPHDAEALFVTPSGDMFIITKDKPAALYRFPRPRGTSGIASLQQVAVLPLDGVTDAEASPGGQWVAVRTKEELAFYRAPQLVGGALGESTRVTVAFAGESQGEGVAIGGDGVVYLAGEGEGRQAPGTLISMSCTFPGTTRRPAQTRRAG